MLRVELGHPRAALGRPPTLFGDGTLLVGLMCGDPDALCAKGYSRISPPVFSLVPRPLRGVRMSEPHP